MQIWRKRSNVRGASLSICFLTLVFSPAVLAQAPPVYKLDASWPKVPLPNKWMMQGVPTMVVDKDDHIWVISRPRDVSRTNRAQAKHRLRETTVASPPRRSWNLIPRQPS